MRGARVDPAAVDAGAVAFRLAPRINAAGRLGRPDIALELVLTEDAAEAKRHAETLEELNRDRQAVEDRILHEAIDAVESMSEPNRRHRGYVLWSENWHEGVIGIVASRLVELFHRPIVLITRSQDGWKGSGRSIASFDLHGALAACSEHLERFGGARRRLGLSIAEEQILAFAGLCVACRRPRRRGRPVRGRARRRGRSARELTSTRSGRSWAPRALRPRETRMYPPRPCDRP
jgi:single-stranded DNA-specific DHH superfamily exonuclease